MFFVIACCISIANADAAVRGTNTVNRTTQQESDKTTGVVARTARSTSANTTARPTTTTARTTGTNTVNRNSTVARGTTTQNKTISRTATNTRGATTPTTSRVTLSSNIARNASPVRNALNTVYNSSRGATARATVIAPSTVTNTFGTEYNTCRNAYFTCMDQFCATANDSYRRCICSSRLTDIQERERALGQASDQLQDFHNLNIEVIPKTAEEVHAMLTASEGELAIIDDKSQSSAQLQNIRDILSSSKSQALSTLGTLDIAGDINQIWATTDLASGENIANLTGESLYNAVHAQCSELVADQCPTQSTLNMVVSAYGMYIENDCTTLLNALDTQLVQANSTIRDTEREMNVARLENYNAHNSTAINDCIAQVRTDITADTACGEDYIHCLDITGRYLNRDTGAPIYSPDFYQLEYQISLEGDVLTNSTNRVIVAELNRKRIYAERGLETCRDIADEVWDEFLRQAIVEIYQGQQAKVREVKNDCLDVVNACYDEQSESLKDFSNIKEELLLGSRLELSEELCQEKLYACSNLYGDPNGNGLELLISAMHDITDQKIAAECQSLLEAFATDMCTVPSNDSLHAYPYGCRVYAPGDAIYASNYYCNQLQWSNTSGSTGPGGPSDPDPDQPTPDQGYVCPEYKKYESCNPGYYMATMGADGTWHHDPVPIAGNSCQACPQGYSCAGGLDAPVSTSEPLPDDPPGPDKDCGPDYAGSLYQKMVRYATQVCTRPSDYEEITAGRMDIPTTVLQDVNIVMDAIRVDMAKSLSAECERLGGLWVDTQWVDTKGGKDALNNDIPDDLHDETGQKLFKYFYDETGANTKWGFCADISVEETEEEEDKEESTTP